MKLYFDSDAEALRQAAAQAPAMTPLWEGGLQEYRELVATMPPPPAPEVAKVNDREVEGPHGPLRLRIYHPAGATNGLLPVLIFCHGGGMVFGSVETHDSFARSLCHESQAVVVSVDYRLAPEHKYPIANDECYYATEWTVHHATELGIDPQRLGVVGDSAGGSLAAAIALRSRDEGGPSVKLQVLLYPGLERSSVPRESMRLFADLEPITFQHVVWMKNQYLGEDESTDTVEGVPSLAKDLRSLPPAIVVTAEYDPLRDGGESYSARLRDASVQTTLIRYPGVGHGFMSYSGWIERATRAFQDVGALARNHLS